MSKYFTIMLFAALTITGCRTPVPDQKSESNPGQESLHFAPVSAAGTAASADVSDFTLQTSMVDGRMAYVGRGGDIDGIVNPDLVVHAGAAVRVTVINGDGMPHDLSIPDLGLRTSLINNKDDSAELSFTVSETQEGTYAYFCTVSGHRQAGMEGKLLVHSNSESASITDNREKR